MYGPKYLQQLTVVVWTAVLVVACRAPTAVPTQPSASSPLIEATPGEPQLALSADPVQLAPGECTTLRWRVEGGFGVELNGEPVDRSGEQRVCPPETTTYSLGVDTGVAIARQEIVVAVAGPWPSPGPAEEPVPAAPQTPPQPVVEEALADLAVVELGFVPGAPQAGDPVLIQAIVRNAGSWDAGDAMVSVWLDGAEVGSQFLGRLAAGEEERIEVRSEGLPAGEHTIEAFANPGRWFEESDETNNALTASLMVREAELPDPVIESLTIDPESPTIGQAVTIRITVRNQGTAPAEGVDVALSIAGAAFSRGQVPVECAPEHFFADEVLAFTAGEGANPDFQDPAAVLGPPDASSYPAKGFCNLGNGGSLTLGFSDNYVIDEPGEDLLVVGRPGEDRSFVVELSADGESFESFGAVRAGTGLDLSRVGLEAAWFVRITDDGSRDRQDSALPGADLDAVEALHCRPLEREPLKLNHLQVIPAIEPGGRQTFTVSWTATPAGEFALVAEVDPLNSCREADEGNNWLDRAIVVRFRE